MEAILYIGISQFLFAALLTFTKSRKQTADLILVFWLLLMCIFMGLTLMKNARPEASWGQLQLFPFFYTIGPFLLLYVQFLTAQKTKLSFVDGLHILPFVVFSAVAVTQMHPVDEDILKGDIFSSSMVIYAITCFASLVYYLSSTFFVLKRHSKNILDHFSYTSRKISLAWVRMATMLISATLILTFSSIMLNTIVGEINLNPGIPLFLGFTLFGYGVTFNGVRQPVIFRGTGEKDLRFEGDLRDEIEPNPVVNKIEKPDKKTEAQKKYSRSGLQTELAEAYLKRLFVLLENEQPYLRRDLTIQNMADELNIPQHHLTQTINELLGKNFYTVVNEFRVEEVKKRLLAPKYKHLTVLAIAHDAGFNSKSSFNMTFKKYVGLTPSQYRKANLT